MTTTVDAQRIPNQQLPVAVDVHDVLDVLRATVGHVAELDPDRLCSGTAAGDALLALAGVARATSTALGDEPGTVLRAGPGVVVVRDLTSAVSLVQRTAARHGGRCPHVPAELARRARTGHGRFLLLAATPA